MFCSKILKFSDCVDIKKRAGCFSHLEDPNRLQTLLAQTLTTEQYKAWKIEPSTLTSFSSDQNIKNFTEKFILPLAATDIDNVGNCSMLEEKIVNQLVLQSYDCLTRDRMHALPIYIQLMAFQRKLEQHQVPQSYVWQIKILTNILDLYKHVNEKDFLLSFEILNSITISYKKEIDKMFELRKFNINDRFDKVSQQHNIELNELNQLAIIWNFYDINHQIEKVDVTPGNILSYIVHLKREGFNCNQIAALAGYVLAKD